MTPDTTELVKRVSRDLFKRVARAARATLPDVVADLRKEVRAAFAADPAAVAIRTSPTVIRQLGLRNPDAAVAAVVDAVAAAAGGRVEEAADEVRLTVYAARADFRDGLDAAAASYESFGRRGASVVRWLEMVLFGEYQQLTATYGMWTKPGGIAASRTGDTIMRPLSRGIRRGFRLDPAVAGTAAANWFTRAAAAVRPRTVALLEAAFRRMTA